MVASGAKKSNQWKSGLGGATGSKVTGAGFLPRHSQDDVRAQGDSQPIHPQT